MNPKPYDEYTIEWLRVGVLTAPVDNGLLPYQRNQGKNGKPGAGLKARYRKYGEFNPNFVKFREVNRREDGTLACMDGNGSNHWIQYELKKGYSFMVPCKVYTGLTLKQEAHMFLGFQRAKTVTRAEEFNAGQVAGAEQFVRAGEIAERCGFEVGTGRKNSVIGYSAVEYMYKFGETRLEETLNFLRNHFGTDPSATNTGFVMALCDVLGNVDLDHDLLIKALAGSTVNDLRENRSGGAAKTTSFHNIMNLYKATMLDSMMTITRPRS